MKLEELFKKLEIQNKIAKEILEDERIVEISGKEREELIGEERALEFVWSKMDHIQDLILDLQTDITNYRCCKQC